MMLDMMIRRHLLAIISMLILIALLLFMISAVVDLTAYSPDDGAARPTHETALVELNFNLGMFISLLLIGVAVFLFWIQQER